MGTILKLLREYRTSGDENYLKEMWPHAKRAMEFTFREWDPDGDGIMEGDQPNTYDCAVHGWSSFTSSLYLASLRAAEEMARHLGDEEFAVECRKRFDTGTVKLDEALWNGEWYVQKPDPGKSMDMQYGEGCHADQVFGQWWAHLLDLGYVLPRDHVRTALSSVMKHNFMESFVGFRQGPRIFASDHDSGTLICSWPKGGKPEKPTLYSDEVWPGIEYEVAGLMLFEGMVQEAFAVILAARGRYDGIQRNPWNEVECGDHYARSMSSWTLLEAALGYRYDAGKRAMGFAPAATPECVRGPFVAAEGWGTFEQELGEDGAHVEISIARGSLTLSTLSLSLPGAVCKAAVGERSIEVMATRDGDMVTITLPEGFRLEAGECLSIAIE